MKYIINTLILILVAQCAYAQLSHKQKLLQAIQFSQKLEQFSYSFEILKFNRAESYDTFNSTITIDYKNKYYKMIDNDQLIIVNNNTVFDLNHIFKTIKIFDRNAYQKKYSGQISNINRIFNKVEGIQMVDSLIRKIDKIEYSIKNGVETYSGKLTEKDIIFDFSLSYNTIKKIPIVYNYRVYSTTGHKLPYLIFRASNYSIDISPDDFLLKDYVIYKDGKYSPIKHKNYKLITTL